MTKQWRIIINLAILLLVVGFALYVVFLMSSHSVEYGNMEDTRSDFISPYTVEATCALPEGAKRLRLCGDTIFVATSDSVFLYTKGRKYINCFYAGAAISDIVVGKGEIYVLFPTKIKRFTPEGELLHEWEACSDNALYASVALTANYVFVTDAENLNICQYTREGQFVRFINSPHGFIIPTGTFDIETFEDTVYCINSGRHRIESYTPEGKFIASFGIPGSQPGTFPGCCNPASIVFTPGGRMLTSEKGNPRICLFERSGRFIGMLLNSKTLGGGHEAYEIQAESNKIYVAGHRTLTIFQYKDNNQFI
jgi:hypothetical protein